MKSWRWNQGHFKARLRVALKFRGVKHKQLATKLKVAPATVSRWQNNPSNFPSLNHLLGAANFLGVEAGWLAFGTGTPPRGMAAALLAAKSRRERKRPVRRLRNKPTPLNAF
jgi:transcriptional regulator with XRE-family HTH domain